LIAGWAVDRLVLIHCCCLAGRRFYSAVTLFARFLGWSTSQPRRTAMWQKRGSIRKEPYRASREPGRHLTSLTTTVRPLGCLPSEIRVVRGYSSGTYRVSAQVKTFIVRGGRGVPKASMYSTHLAYAKFPEIVGARWSDDELATMYGPPSECKGKVYE